jgi:hypothetical protein
MTNEEKPEGMGLRDRVYSDRFVIGGIVDELSKCSHCGAPALALVDDDGKFLGLYLVESFKVVGHKD